MTDYDCMHYFILLYESGHFWTHTFWIIDGAIIVNTYY